MASQIDGAGLWYSLSEAVKHKNMLPLMLLLESLERNWWPLLCLRLTLTYFLKCNLVGKWQDDSQIQDIIAAINTDIKVPIFILIKLNQKIDED